MSAMRYDEITTDNINEKFMEFLAEYNRGTVILNTGVSNLNRFMKSVASQLVEFFKTFNMGSIKYENIENTTIIFSLWGLNAQTATIFRINAQRSKETVDGKSVYKLEGILVEPDPFSVHEAIRDQPSLNKRYKYMVQFKKQVDGGFTTSNKLIFHSEIEGLLKDLQKHDLSIDEFEALINKVMDIGGFKSASSVPGFLRKLKEIMTK